jgi:hypothetical protein
MKKFKLKNYTGVPIKIDRKLWGPFHYRPGWLGIRQNYCGSAGGIGTSDVSETTCKHCQRKLKRCWEFFRVFPLDKRVRMWHI